MDTFTRIVIDGLAAGSFYALVAVGYSLAFRVSGVINFAHNEVIMLGTFACLLVAQALGVHVGAAFGGGTMTAVGVLLLCAVAAIVVGCVAALGLDRFAYRPLRKRGANVITTLITALGASLLLQEGVAKWRGRDLEAFPRLISKHELFSIGGVAVRNDAVVVVVSATVFCFAINMFITRTDFGKNIRATAINPDVAGLMGVDINRVIGITYMLAGIAAGVAAVLFVFYYENTSYIMGFSLGIKGLTAAILGGLGDVKGALAGGLVLGLAENFGASLFGSEWKDVIAFVVLIVLLTVRAQGLLGGRRVEVRA